MQDHLKATGSPSAEIVIRASVDAAERLNWRTIISANSETPPDIIETLDEYFKHFVQMPIEEKDGKKQFKTQNCIKCDEPLTGFMAVLASKGGFTWGIAHGEGHCANCRWPARAHHFIKDKDGKDLMTLHNVILQYHPDFVSHRGKAAAVSGDRTDADANAAGSVNQSEQNL